MKIFITGAGLIGCHSAAALVEGGHNVTLYDVTPNANYVNAIAGSKRVNVIRGDLLDLPALLRAMKAVKPAVVVHSAGFIGSQVANPPYRGIQTNIIGSTNTFEAAQLSGVKRIVHVSTFGVYDWDNIKRGPVTEDFPRWGTQFYHATKVANELLLGAYKDYYGLETVVVRPASVYGPGHYRGGSGGGKNMAELARQCLGSSPIEIYEKRVGSNDFVYAKDVGRGIALACASKGAAGKAFNIGTGELYTPQDFRRVITKLCPKREIKLIKGDDSGRAGNERINISLAQAKRILGYTPKYKLAQGFKDYLAVSRKHGFWS
jgi:nucleoside-diphosphate-sugar epimerase